MNFKSVKETWDYLKKEYFGSERTKGIQLSNFARELKMQSIKETKRIKSYVDRLMSITKKVQLRGKPFLDEKIVQKILVTVPKKNE